ncbi:MAG TPA: iron ABC transporter permease [Actinomycetota bacterium]|nr:iron ABC transporter permease [Actinomycetota bacterium]
MGSSDGRVRSRWIAAAAGGVAVVFAAPFVYLVGRNLREPATAWAELTSGDAWGPLARSVLLAVLVSVSATVVGAGAAWLVARTDVPGARAWRVLLPLPLVMPSFIGAFVFVAALAPGGLLEAVLRPFGAGRLPGIGGLGGSFLVLTLFTYPYVYLPARARFRRLAPSLEESARLLGRGSWSTFWRVVVPQARGAILAGTLLVFLYTVSEFGVVQLMRYDTLTRSIYATRFLDPARSFALSLQLGLLAVAVVVAERAFARGGAVPRESQRDHRAMTLALGRWRAAALAFLTALVGTALVLPVGVLAWWAARGAARGATSASGGFGDVAGLGRSILNTSFVSLAAALTAVVAVLPVAYLIVRRKGLAAAAANAVVVGGFALPGLAIALSLVAFSVDAPGPLAALYQTIPLLVLAYVVHFGAPALRTAQVAIAGIPQRVEDAARTLGASRFDRLRRVELPMMLPGLLAGAGLVLLSSMKELPATLLLAPAGFQTLAMKVWTATESAFFADASLAALVLVALSGVLTWLLVIRRGDVLV